MDNAQGCFSMTLRGHSKAKYIHASTLKLDSGMLLDDSQDQPRTETCLWDAIRWIPRLQRTDLLNQAHGVKIVLVIIQTN